jgi:uncharacterized repeat protein (TIGR03803 family)
VVKFSKLSNRIFLTLAIVIAIVVLAGGASAQAPSFQSPTIYDFRKSATDAWAPHGTLIATKNGDLYGVGGGGTNGFGALYKLTSPQNRGDAWAELLIYSFVGGDGRTEPVSIVMGPDGHLYGFTFNSVFSFQPPTHSGDSWKYNALYTLNFSDGSIILGNPAFDREGNIYGAAEFGGDPYCDESQNGCGTVFELKRPKNKDGKWRARAIHTFPADPCSTCTLDWPGGAWPMAGVVIDKKGNLYGTTGSGGAFGWGTVYRVSPPGKKGGAWRETVLYSFNKSNSWIVRPSGPVTLDAAGNLYGTTPAGGDPNCQSGFGCGVVFELSPPLTKGQPWAYANLYEFQGGSDGISPNGYMVFDDNGDLYGITNYGGEGQGGTVFSLSPPKEQGGPWTEAVLASFTYTGGGGDGAWPAGGLVWGKWHDLYDITVLGGICYTCGTAFEVAP